LYANRTLYNSEQVICELTVVIHFFVWTFKFKDVYLFLLLENKI